MKKYAVIPKHSFARLTKFYSVINQVFIGETGKPSGWALLESYMSTVEESEIKEVGGLVFDSTEDLFNWQTQLDAGTLPEEGEKPLQVVVLMANKGGYTRDARNIGTFQAGTDRAEMVLFVEVRSYDSTGIEVKELRKETYLVADNTVRIPLADGSDVGEYDYLLNAINQSSDIKTVISDVLQNRSTDGTIDRKLGLA